MRGRITQPRGGNAERWLAHLSEWCTRTVGKGEGDLQSYSTFQRTGIEINLALRVLNAHIVIIGCTLEHCKIGVGNLLPSTL